MSDFSDLPAALGERIRRLRALRNWSLERLSGECGVSRSMLSQIERGEANPTLAVVFRIARALSMTIDELVEPPTPRRISTIAHDDRSALFRDDDDCRIRTLSPLELEKDVEFYEVIVREGRALSSSAHHPGTREFLTLERGLLSVVCGEDSQQLSPGDSAHYPADVAHELRSVGPGDAGLFLVVLYAPSRAYGS